MCLDVLFPAIVSVHWEPNSTVGGSQKFVDTLSNQTTLMPNLIIKIL